MKSRTLAFIDTETTGLEVSDTNHEVIEFAIVIEKGGKILSKQVHKIKPHRLFLAQEKALEVNGYTEKDWEDAISKEEAGQIIKHTLCYEYNSDLLIVGHNVNFDRDGINALLKECGLKNKYGGDLTITHRCFDTQALVMEHLFDLGLHSSSLKNIRTFFNWSHQKAHTSLQDTLDCRKLYHKLLRANWIKRLWWKLTCVPRVSQRK